MTDPETITHQTALEVFHLAYARRVGVGSARMGYGELQDRTGIPVRTLKSWREGQAMPHLDNWLKLCAVFGPSFTSEVLGVIEQGGVESIAPAQHSNALVCSADLSCALHEITERLRDGKFCHKDKGVVGPMLLNLAHLAEEQGKAMLAEVPH